jgi:glyoxylase-like metal-dependent hydrolase (beta-lactamase superfamily II)
MSKRSLERELKRSVVLEIAPDVWMLEGFLGDRFFVEAPSSNMYMLRDGDSLLILDTGNYGLYRGRMLEIIERYKRNGVKRITLMVTQGHFDHAANNTVVLESGLPWRFLLPEPELPTISFVNDVLQDLERLGEYESVYTTMFPWSGRMAVVRAAGTLSPALARRLTKAMVQKVMGGIETLAGQAELLSLDSRVTRQVGSVTLTGWEVGRFFAIHDASHTPGHICLYDPDNKLLLAGDVTIEINPAYFYSSMDKCREACGWFRRMAEEGTIELAGDGHRSRTRFADILDRFGASPLHETQTAHVMEGREACAAFFSTFERYYGQLQQEVINAHRRIGDSTVGEIVEELVSSRSPAVQLKKSITFPRWPNRMDVLVASVLREAGVIPRREGARILLAPPVEKELHGDGTRAE